jgi:hypothetical protein
MEKQVTINGKVRTISVSDLIIIGVERTGINVSGKCYNYSLVCSSTKAADTIDDILSDISSLSMFANDVRVPITDARLRKVKTLAPLAPAVSEDIAESELKTWDDLLSKQFEGKEISVKKLTASVNELTNGLRDSYTLTINGRAIENVTARTTAYIDDDTAAYERLRKQVNADILLSESAGNAEGGEE